MEEARQQASRLQSGAVTKLPADAEDHSIPGGSTGTIRSIRPKDNKDALPVVLYFHGGGWVLNDKESFDPLLREIANDADVFVEYTRSPGARYPVAIEEAYAATKWIAENGSPLRLDPSRLAVVGDSSGGNMAAAVTLMAKERGGPKIDLQVLLSPIADATPPALVITGECDPLRDEGEAYAGKLMEAGVRVIAARYLGTIHALEKLHGLPIRLQFVSRSAHFPPGAFPVLCAEIAPYLVSTLIGCGDLEGHVGSDKLAEIDRLEILGDEVQLKGKQTTKLLATAEPRGQKDVFSKGRVHLDRTISL